MISDLSYPPPDEMATPIGGRRPPIGQVVTAWVLSVVGKAKAQLLPSGAYYFELCPAYVATVPGAPTYHYCRIAWNDILSMARGAGHRLDVISTAMARGIGAHVRHLGDGERRGRNLVVDAGCMAWIDSLIDRLIGRTGWTPPDPPSDAPWVPVHVDRDRVRRTVSVRCPYHNDIHPSLVVRLDKSDGTYRSPVYGTGRCAACGVTVAVRRVGNEWVVRLPGGNEKRRDRRVLGRDLQYHQGDMLDEPPVGPAPLPGMKPLGGVVSTLRWWAGALRRTVGHRVAQDEHDRVGIWSMADVRSRSPAAVERAQEMAAMAMETAPADRGTGSPDDADLMPISLAAGCAVRPDGWVPVYGGGERPAGWTPVETRWITWDIDGMVNAPWTGQNDTTDDRWISVEAIGRILKSERTLTGEFMVVRSGPWGVHVHARLTRPVRMPSRWMADPRTRAWHDRVGRSILAALGSVAMGGRSDPAACEATRWWRLPGWRIMDGGRLFRTRVVAIVPGPTP